jgi:hypothetical protein
MTPKKIYIAQVYLDELIDSEDYHEQDVTVALSPYNEDVNQNAYILESEHNRIVDEFKAENEKLKDFAKLSKANLDDWVRHCPELYVTEDLDVYEAYKKLNIKDK